MPTIDAFHADLARSGLTPEDAKTLGFRLVPAGKPDHRIAANIDRTSDLYTIPYHDPSGKPTGAYRTRRLGEPTGFARYAPKVQRYSQPSGSTPELYIPRNFRGWTEYLANPASHALIFTEGEKKAACACKLGIPTLALGGVSSYQSKKLGKRLLDALEAINLKDRDVYIGYDTDVRTNPNVQRALFGFSSELLRLGAKVYDLILPELTEDGKTGLDDFLVAQGANALAACIQDAKLFANSRAFHELSLEVAFVEDPPHYIQLEKHIRMTNGSFTKDCYRMRTYLKTSTTQNGTTTMKITPTAPDWIAWPGRNTVARLTYEPGKPNITNERALNLWPGMGAEPKRGDVSPFLRVVDHLLMGATPENRLWFSRWLACPLQHPGVKLYTAVLFWGTKQGTGKSAIGLTMGDIYGANFSEIQPSHLHDKFNEWAGRKQFVLGDEIAGGDRRADGDYVKRIITQEKVTINEKYVPKIVLPDCINYYFTSNHPDSFYIEPGDRRFFIHEVVVDPLPSRAYAAFDKWRKDGGASALYYYLLHLDLGDFSPTDHAPMSSAKQDMARMTASDLDSWVLDLLADPVRVISGVIGQTTPRDLYTAKELLAYYDPDGRKRVTANGVSRALAKAGAKRVGDKYGQSTTNVGLIRLWAIANSDKWATAKYAEIREHYDKHLMPVAHRHG